MIIYKSREDDLSRNYDLNFLDYFNHGSILPNVNDTTNSRANATEATIPNQEHQDYYDQQDLQYITCNYNSGLEQVTMKLVPDIILEEEEYINYYLLYWLP